MKNCEVPLSDLLQAITLLMQETYFQFNNKFYQQIHGTAMGSPCSPRFADLVMTDLEENCIEQLSFKPLYYGRYVDDIFTIIPKNKVSEIIDIFNSYHQRLQFTHEYEVNGTLNFLEVKLIRNNRKILTDWYQKSTFSGRVLSFKSNHTYSQKSAMVYTMIDKAILLSDRQFHNKNINLVKNILRNNSYPENFINTHIQKRLKLKHNNKDFSVPNSTNNNVTKNHKKNSASLTLPYNKEFFESVSNKLKKYNIQTVPSINSNFNSIIKRGKDKTERDNVTNVVYKIECNNCEASYVGETKRKLSTRVKEHEKNSLKTDTQLVINEHMENTGHTFNFKNAKILDRESNWNRRILSEMMHINLQKQPINKKEDSQNLQSTYITLLNDLKNKKNS